MKFQNYTKFQPFRVSMQYVCFNCRKVFKKSFDALRVKDQQKTCPECSAHMYRAGTAFKAPKKEDKKQWDKVKLLITNGFIFYRNSLGISLKTPREAILFLEKGGKIQIDTNEFKDRKSLIERKKIRK